MTKKITILNSATSLFEKNYENGFIDKKFDNNEMVLLGVSLYEFSNNERYKIIISKILQDMTSVEQDKMYQEYEISYDLVSNLNEYDTVDWPEPIYNNHSYTLDELKIIYGSKVDKAFGNERLKYITDIPGQEMTYMEKKSEALEVLVDPDPETNAENKYPLLYADIGINSDTIFGVAQVVIYMLHQWKMLNSAFEKQRLDIKKKITAATSEEDLENIMSFKIGK